VRGRRNPRLPVADAPSHIRPQPLPWPPHGVLIDHPASITPVRRVTGCLGTRGGAGLPAFRQAELVAFRVVEQQVVRVFRHQGRAESLEPVDFVR
jgi:hypothetical protein